MEKHIPPPDAKPLPIVLTPSDGILLVTLAWREKTHYLTEHTYIKASVEQSGLNMYGEQIVISYKCERPKKKFVVLKSISEHTTIPVPEPLDLWEENGLLHLETAFVKEAIGLYYISEDQINTAVAETEWQLEAEVFPQLRKLPKSRRLGSPDPTVPIFPPHRPYTQEIRIVSGRKLPETITYFATAT